MKMNMNLRDSLDELQRADQPRKRKWLLGLSVLAVFLVIFGWTTYFSAAILPASRPAAGSDRNFSFRETFGAGLSVVGDSVLAGFRGLGRIWSTPRTYEISP